MNKDIVLVIVILHPSAEELDQIKRLSTAYAGVVVDNSSEPITNGDIGSLHYMYNGNKDGIAGAQTLAVSYLLEKKIADYVVFVDQDSSIDIDYPASICREYQSIARIFPLAILGPTVLHKDDGEEYKSVVHKDKLLDHGFIPRRDVISSGSCIKLSLFNGTLKIDKALFIDYVDFDLCWQAESKGLVCGITSRIKIKHKVGQRELSLGKYKVIISNPKRYFFQYRNYLWLAKRRYVPFQWKVASGIKLILRFFYFPLLLKDGPRIWINMAKGIFAGLNCKMKIR